MTKLYLSLITFFLLLATLGWSQTFTVKVNGVNRTYILYAPPGHNANIPAPLVLNYHGYTSNAGQQAFYSNMNPVADTAGFIVVYPEGLNNSWNTFSPLVTTPDDVAFTSAIIDDVNKRFKIDAARVYACGMSNGGYMSHLLGCELENRIAAVASVTGLLAPAIMAQCNPSRPIPVLQIHGTNDMTVPYNGGIGIGSVDSTVQFWLAANHCSTSNFTIDTLPNTNSTDNSYPIRYRSQGCDAGSEVTLIKIVNGSHTWPNAPYLIPNLVPNKDIDASSQVWNFFKGYTHPNPAPLDTTTTTTNIKQVNEGNKLVKMYPNPMGNILTVEVTDSRVKSIALYDVLGAKIYEASINQLPVKMQFNTTNLQAGVYFLRVETANGQTTYKLVK
ncbi:hypothetical protein BH09BAC1_BH09BAC1_09030 [soil metagenome]